MQIQGLLTCSQQFTKTLNKLIKIRATTRICLLHLKSFSDLLESIAYSMQLVAHLEGHVWPPETLRYQLGQPFAMLVEIDQRKDRQ